LMNRGIPEAQIEIRGMGIQDPIATNDTPAGRLKNRRVEIEVIDDGV
jgi:OOP family OmpA-OmpF porin